MLTVKAVEAAKPRDRPYKLADGEGLYLFVSPAGARSWRANFTIDGKQQTRTYGRYPEMGLPAAREAHRSARDAKSDTTTPTFEEVARAWIQKHTPGLSNLKHRLQVEKTLETYAFPHIGAKPIGELRRADLVRAVESVGSKVETAHRVAGRISAVFNYALDAGILEAHPAANLTRVLTPRKVKKPMASIPPSEAGELLRRIQTYPDPVTRLALLLMAHTFVRVGELRGFDRDELKEGGSIWLIPESRMKLKLPHVVPLTPQAKAIVKELSERSGSNLLLESPAKPGQPISENTMLFALYRLGYRGSMTVHGFRALASTVLNEQSGFSHDVIERQLAHKETDAVRAAYNRAEHLPARRQMMAWWSAWLDAAQAQTPASA